MSGDEFTVRVGHEGTDTIEAAVDTFESRGSFGVVLENHAGPTHVHCRLDGELPRIASLEESNYYVEAERQTFVPVLVDDLESEARGRLELSTGYGAASTTVDVTVLPARTAVDVDESLTRPPENEPEPTPFERALESVTGGGGLGPAGFAVIALAVIALALGVVTAGVVGGPVAVAGVRVVTVGVAVALFLLW